MHTGLNSAMSHFKVMSMPRMDERHEIVREPSFEKSIKSASVNNSPLKINILDSVEKQPTSSHKRMLTDTDAMLRVMSSKNSPLSSGIESKEDLEGPSIDDDAKLKVLPRVGSFLNKELSSNNAL
jgi:hypothetical protein